MISTCKDIFFENNSDIKIEFLTTLDNKVFDLSYYTGRCEIKLHPASFHTLFYATVLIDSNPATGKFELIIPKSELKKLNNTIAYYSIIFSNPLGNIINPYFGKLEKIG